MNRRFVCLLIFAVCVVLLPSRSPAPLIYTPGEGFTYEPYGSEGAWRRNTAKEQLVVAQGAFDEKDYSTALKAARRVVSAWPFSDYAPQAQYLVGRCYEARGWNEKAFKAYQKLVESYPKAINYDEVLQRQFDIATRFLNGERFRLLNYIPLFPNMDKTAQLFDRIVQNGPYSEIAPRAQMSIGEAREKQSNYPEAMKAYERAADRYNDRPVAADALFKQGVACYRQAATAEYDQSIAGLAIAAFTDFMTLYPNDPRVPEAQKMIGALKTEQARGSFNTAKFYERYNRPRSAKIYYNEVVRLSNESNDPNSPYAVQARERIEAINQRLETASQ